MAFDVGRALEELGINGFKIQGNPTTEAEFNTMFQKIVSHGEDGAPVFSSDPDDFGITWAEVIGAKTALNNIFGKQDLRYERDRRLKETDFWALQDSPDMTQAQRDYRQQLRDITDSYNSLEDVVWPTKP